MVEITPKIKWINPNRVLGKTIGSCFKPAEMLKDFVKHGLLEEITDNYSSDVYMLCRNGATWLGAHMANMCMEVQIVEGTFMGDSHCWVVFGDYYFDMTIAQSDPTYPQFACCLIKDAEGYEEFKRFDVMEWMEDAA